MVGNSPDPTDNNPYEVTARPRFSLIANGNPGEESDEENDDHVGYEPLPQAPHAISAVDDDDESDDETENIRETPPVNDIPSIEPIETTLTRELWNNPRPADSIQMDSERAQQVITAMANFVLPEASIPQWAQSISEEQWKQRLYDRIEKIKSNR